MSCLALSVRKRSNPNKSNYQGPTFIFYSFSFPLTKSHYNKFEHCTAFRDAITNTSQFIFQNWLIYICMQDAETDFTKYTHPRIGQIALNLSCIIYGLHLAFNLCRFCELLWTDISGASSLLYMQRTEEVQSSSVLGEECCMLFKIKGEIRNIMKHSTSK